MINYIKSLFQSKEPEPIYQGEIAPWVDDDALALHEFLNSSTGIHLMNHLRKHQLEVNQWATDVSMENYENMKYRACVAHGVKLDQDYLRSLSRARPKSKHQETSKEMMDKFINRRMGMFKS